LGTIIPRLIAGSDGEFAMPGVRIDRLLASTAAVLLLSGVAGALAEPKFGPNLDAKTSQPAVSQPAPGTTEQPAAQPAEPSSEPAMPAPAVKPQSSTEQPQVALAKPDQSSEQRTSALQAAPATPDGPADQPAATTPVPAAASARSTEMPAAPAATGTPPAEAEMSAAMPTQPAAATEGDEVPIPTAAAPRSSPAATPATIADANAPVADKLRELANGKFDRALGGKKERAAFEAFYSARNYAPLWITDGKANARAKAATAYLAHVDADGLDPTDYPVPDLTSPSDPAALADAEVRLSATLVTYAHHAAVGRVHWTRVSGDILYDLKVPTPAEVLAGMADATDVSETLAAYEPQNPGYVALRAKLAELRAGKADAAKAPTANGPALKIGVADARVPQLRERLGVGGNGATFDKMLSDAVKKFQQEHELKATGQLTPQTVEALNGRQPDRPIDTVIANLERWRWMPHDLGKTYVMVNLPDFTLHVIQNGSQVWMTKIVDGKPNMPTPIMSAEMKFITVNPTWNVPPSIVAKEYLPALQQDPTVLWRMGLKVSTNPDGTVHISQPPGEANALGRLRFNFPNKFLVYQHDTPNKNLFALDKRALSHGCMRVQDPLKYAEVLLSIVRPGEGYTEDRIRKMFGQGELDIQFPKFISVNLTYQTAFVDEDGQLQFRDDVYGRDKALLAILKGDERKVADIPVEHRENTVRREALAMPEPGLFGGGFGGRAFDLGGGFGGRAYYPGGGFFSQLFGPPAPPPAPIPGQRKRASQNRQEIQ
jgi:L,D-transpeptidase YcbB